MCDLSNMAAKKRCQYWWESEKTCLVFTASFGSHLPVSPLNYDGKAKKATQKPGVNVSGLTFPMGVSPRFF